jgi:hypothetical protein
MPHTPAAMKAMFVNLNVVLGSDEWVFVKVESARGLMPISLAASPFESRYSERTANRLAFDPFDVLTHVQRRNVSRPHAHRRLDGDRIARDCGAGRQDNGALDRVLQLTHVARSVVLLEERDDAVLKRMDCSSAPRRMLVSEVLHQHLNILDALAKRGHDDRHDVQAIEEIVLEPR